MCPYLARIVSQLVGQRSVKTCQVFKIHLNRINTCTHMKINKHINNTNVFVETKAQLAHKLPLQRTGLVICAQFIVVDGLLFLLVLV